LLFWFLWRYRRLTDNVRR